MCLLSVCVTPFSFIEIEFEQRAHTIENNCNSTGDTETETQGERMQSKPNSKRTETTRKKSGLYQKSISNLIAATIIAKFDDVKMIIIADNALFCNNAAVHLRLLLAVITHKTGQVAVVLFFWFVLLCLSQKKEHHKK